MRESRSRTWSDRIASAPYNISSSTTSTKLALFSLSYKQITVARRRFSAICNFNLYASRMIMLSFRLCKSSQHCTYTWVMLCYGVNAILNCAKLGCSIMTIAFLQRRRAYKNSKCLSLGPMRNSRISLSMFCDGSPGINGTNLLKVPSMAGFSLGAAFFPFAYRLSTIISKSI